MKNIIIALLLPLLFVPCFSQDIRYEVHGSYSRSITKEKLHQATSMSDVIQEYPAEWITNYVSVEILAICNGKAVKANSANDILTAEQQNILRTADMGTDVVINVNYKTKNSVTDNLENSKMHCALTVVPEVKAEYLGGYQQLTHFLQENGISKISETDSKDIQPAVVKFTVDEQGEIANAQISKTSGNKNIDNVLLKAVNSMPKWKPAQNAKGVKVKQDFVFSVGNSGC